MMMDLAQSEEIMQLYGGALGKIERSLHGSKQYAEQIRKWFLKHSGYQMLTSKNMACEFFKIMADTLSEE
jgi:hypothetical protein